MNFDASDTFKLPIGYGSPRHKGQYYPLAGGGIIGTTRLTVARTHTQGIESVHCTGIYIQGIESVCCTGIYAYILGMRECPMHWNYIQGIESVHCTGIYTRDERVSDAQDYIYQGVNAQCLITAYPLFENGNV